MITFHKPKTVTYYNLFTKSGKPIYNFGRSFTLEAASHRIATSNLAMENPELCARRLEKAKQVLGEECEWRLMGETEIMNVSF